MSEDRAGPALAEILDEIGWLRERTANMTFDGFMADRTLRYAVERSIEIVSEASRRISDEAKAAMPEIPWRAIAGVGNILRHAYPSVAPRIVWDVVTIDLPALETAITGMLRRRMANPKLE